MGSRRRWAVDFSYVSTAASSRDIPDPPGFSRASQDQDDSTLSRQKKDAEANWKAQVRLNLRICAFSFITIMRLIVTSVLESQVELS
ncbi:Transmembrane protein 85 [Tripterygium wilfordii]|uniref:ER membrane protein complex subunit 4 n=1 Tax=Tripterygium wilfordii TaxID=458696 RepID=A0A7J7CAL2_TRIWF|nr:Transmembrane protein 85 [Tripterygium wilfordii]